MEGSTPYGLLLHFKALEKKVCAFTQLPLPVRLPYVSLSAGTGVLSRGCLIVFS